MGRIYNFSAGPSVLPESVLEQAAAEMTDYRGCGMSVMEMSHRSTVFQQIIDEAEQDLRRLLEIPDHYRVLFLQGGASTQFSAIPLNLFGKSAKADYIDTGSWSKKAAAEARRYGQVNMVASSSDSGYTCLPQLDGVGYDPDAAYVHITSNNTIFGTAWRHFPDTGSIPLVADMSSDFLSRPIDVTKFGLIYAGAQKNAGPAGVTLVIIREDLIGNALAITPNMLDYQTAADAGSMYNTPPCYAIYMMGLVFKWLLDLGGLREIQRRNHAKAKLLYDYLDQSRIFRATVAEPFRSYMNIPFLTDNDAWNKTFIAESEKAGLANLKGHRSVGGMRASLYNAMPCEGVAALVAFMQDSEHRFGA